MKIQMKLHLLYIVAIVLLASCENEIPYNPDNQQPLLIMNAQLDAGKTLRSLSALEQGQQHSTFERSYTDLVYQ